MDTGFRDYYTSGSVLRYKTRGDAGPQGRPRVYFCCHEDDFTKTFDKITDEILEIQRNAAVWYRDPDRPFPDSDSFLDDLAMMQLFVIPITSNFLFTEDPARTVEFAFAEERHIPVLPLMQEPGLEKEFNRICGDLQFLDEKAARTDATALPYEDKLKRFLGSVLVDDKLADRIRAAFDAYIFLSYRKKDRAAAQKVMETIHRIKACRDTAIWYDEFLTPGENFNEEIEEAMRKSRLFAMVVTPSLLEDPNYVQATEYPAAVNMNMRVLPVMAEKTDDEELRRMYRGIGDCFPAGDPVAIAARLRELMKDVVLGSKRNDPEHQFLMGLAYLSGVDVEINQNRAVDLIARAAEEGKLPEAYEKMVTMYRTGDAVERDYDEALGWQEEYVEVLEKKAEEEQTADAWQDYFIALTYLQTYLAEQDYEEAYDTAVKMKETAEKLRQMGHERALWDLSVAYERLGDDYSDSDELKQAEACYEKSLEAREEIAEKTGSAEAKSDLGFSYSRMGDICRATGRFDEALDWYVKELDIRFWAEGDEARKPLADTYCKIGDLYGSYGHWKEARKWYEKDIDISRKIYDETGTAEAAQDLAVSYGRMGMCASGEGNKWDARFWYEKDVELSRKAYYETESLNSLWNLSVVYEYMGDLCMADGKFEEAREWYFSCEDKCDEIEEMSPTIESQRNHAAICLKLGDMYVLWGEPKFAQEWYEQDREIKLAVAAAEMEDDDEEEGGASENSLEGLAVNCYKLGTLKTLAADERKRYLEELVQIGNTLYRATGREEHLNYILLGQSELMKL